MGGSLVSHGAVDFLELALTLQCGAQDGVQGGLATMSPLGYTAMTSGS
jgi:hypothetical protein